MQEGPSRAPERAPISDEQAVEALRSDDLETAGEFYGQLQEEADRNPRAASRSILGMRWANTLEAAGRAGEALEVIEDIITDVTQWSELLRDNEMDMQHVASILVKMKQKRERLAAALGR